MHATSLLRPHPLVCLANAVSNAGVAWYRSKQRAQAGDAFLLAADCHALALELRERCSDLRGLSSTLGNQALLATTTSEQLVLYRRSLDIRVRLGDVWGVAGSHRAIAQVHAKAGNVDEARSHLREASRAFWLVGDRLGIAECLETCAVLQETKGRSDVAAQQRAALAFGAALAVRRHAGAATDVIEADPIANHLRSACADQFCAGERLTLREAFRLFDSGDI